MTGKFPRSTLKNTDDLGIFENFTSTLVLGYKKADAKCKELEFSHHFCPFRSAILDNLKRGRVPPVCISLGYELIVLQKIHENPSKVLAKAVSSYVL